MFKLYIYKYRFTLCVYIYIRILFEPRVVSKTCWRSVTSMASFWTPSTGKASPPFTSISSLVSVRMATLMATTNSWLQLANTLATQIVWSFRKWWEARIPLNPANSWQACWWMKMKANLLCHHLLDLQMTWSRSNKQQNHNHPTQLHRQSTYNKQVQQHPWKQKSRSRQKQSK